MSYRIEPLSLVDFAGYRHMDSARLAAVGARRMIAFADRGFPCGVSLENVRAGERDNYVSQDVRGRCRTAYAICVREDAPQAESLIDRLPSVFGGGRRSLRDCDGPGMLVGAILAEPDTVEDDIGQLFANSANACIHAHKAAYGCFAARIERNGEVT